MSALHINFLLAITFPVYLQVCVMEAQSNLSKELFVEQYATQSKVIKILLKMITDIFSTLNLSNVSNKEFAF